MATITVRVDDTTRDALDEKASYEGVTLSDLIRALLQEAVVPVRDEMPSQGSLAPETLTPTDRKMLSLLHRILARVLPEDANDVDGDLEYQLARAKVLEAGYTREYSMEFVGIEPELSSRDCARVMDILDMFRIADYSIDKLAKAGTPVVDEVAEGLTYEGFDFNNPLEAQMAGYVEFLIDDDRWSERKEFIEGPDGGNSHMPTLDMYLRMLAEYRRIKDVRRRRRTSVTDYHLSAEELAAIAAERVHPENRSSN